MKATRIMFAIKAIEDNEIASRMDDYQAGEMRTLLEQQNWQVLIYSIDFHFYATLFNPIGAIKRWLTRQDGGKKPIIEYLRQAAE